MRRYSMSKNKLLHWIKQWEAAEERTQAHRQVLFNEFYDTLMFNTDDNTPALLTAQESWSSSACKAFEEWLCRTHPSIIILLE